jgi:DtxR family Mn-dependent transcriptional regulator
LSPILSLLAFGLAVAVLAWAFWPRSGPVARFARMLRLTDRVLMEDALKHLFDCETRGTPATLESLAGAIEASRARALSVTGRLEALGLAVAGGSGYSLSADGRRYALRLLRTHRLVERYLADRTGMAPGEWHHEAERWEHRLSEAETERLARRMGQPVYDPHGDPIPSARGVLPERQGMPLNDVSAGSTVAIIHLEDEPREVFERLLDVGLAPGGTLRVLEVTPGRIRFMLDGRESSLAAALARNVTVLPRDDQAERELPSMTLADIGAGESAVVVGIASACQGPQRRRLLDLGVVPGTLVRGIMASAAGDPMAYDIRGALIGLRRQQAVWIRVRRSDAGAEAA